MPFRALDPALGIIGRARIVTRDDRATAQRRVQRALETIDSERISRREILVVRRVHERLPAGANGAGAFGRSATGTLTALRNRAVRAGAAARGADAVLFESHEELLLHLALDLAAGHAADRWYWRELRSTLGLELRGSPTGLLIAEPRSAPAVVSLALARGKLAALARATTGDEGWPLIDALGVASGMGRLSQTLRPARSAPGAAAEANRGAPPADVAETEPSRRNGRETVPSVAVPRAVDIAEIIGPEASRELTPFVPEVRAAYALALSLHAAPGSRARVEAAVRSALMERVARDSQPARRPGRVRAEPRTAAPPIRKRAATEANPTRPAAEQANAPLPYVGKAVEDRSVNGHPDLESDATTATSEGTDQVRPAGTRVGLAGVFFLVPLLGARAAQLAESNDAGGWDVFRSAAWNLTALAFRDGDESWRRDLVWSLPLVSTSGEGARENEMVTAPLRQLAARWPTTGPRQLRGRLRRLLERPGVVHMTKTHVDVVFRLEQADLDIRRAGLDIDPGWVPWLGRVITFVYE